MSFFFIDRFSGYEQPEQLKCIIVVTDPLVTDRAPTERNQRVILKIKQENIKKPSK